MHLTHVHNALEFADLREGAQYEITVAGEAVNPLAYVAAHAAFKGQLEQDPLVRAVFEKLVATGITTHNAEHVLGALLLETEWETARAVEAGKDPQAAQKRYIRRLENLIREIAYRKKVAGQFGAGHSGFE